MIPIAVTSSGTGSVTNKTRAMKIIRKTRNVPTVAADIDIC